MDNIQDLFPVCLSRCSPDMFVEREKPMRLSFHNVEDNLKDLPLRSVFEKMSPEYAPFAGDPMWL